MGVPKFAVPSADLWDWGNTVNWSLTDGGASGAAVPVSTDDAYVKQGSYSLGPSNLNQSAVTLNSLNILGGLGGTRSGLLFPSGSSPLQINATTLNIQSERVSRISLSGVFTTIDVKQLRSGELYLSGGSVTSFYGGSSGFAQIGDDVEATLIHSAGMGLEILADASAAGDLEIVASRGARITCARKLSTGVIEGHLTLKDAASIAISAGSTNVVVGNGGVLVLNSSGALGIIKALTGSRVTSKGMPGFATAPVLTTLLYHANSQIDVPKGSLTITNQTPVGDYDSNNSAPTA